MIVRCDFHNHTCLSPCGSLDQPPSVLARVARQRGLYLVAITDHNSARNAPAFQECARREGLMALYGMEVTSAEDVHIVCVFATVDEALDFGIFVAAHQPLVPYDPDKLGDQVVVDADDNVLDMPEHYLGVALDLDFGAVCNAAANRNALVIPAHIDREAYGALAHLGFLPEGPYTAIEMVAPSRRTSEYPYTIITGSDAHYPQHIGRRSFGLELPDGWDRQPMNLDLIRNALMRGNVLNVGV